MNIRKIATLAGATVLALTAGVGLAGTAHAGTRGQQILLLNNTGYTSSFWVSGRDQNGNFAGGCFATTGYQTWVSGWWWTGNVTAAAYHGTTNCSGSAYTQTDAYIPTSSSNDWQAVADVVRSINGNNQMIEFFDNEHIANSVKVSGYNQGGMLVSNCWSTPGWDTQLNGWWWNGSVGIETYSSSNCGGTRNGYFTYQLGGVDGSWFGAAD
ncbi:hypothetical protein [Streptacidiphilus jiangxiensis]|uniref:Uncharacterized protein n=1 Tax=Streptacidiphilus jiangxiensis TaxID=235985 RepID=A0A1H7P1Q0_STRJI|nr:hypothetical protein [Streptacidiphilus jiangxiensis]SEL29248.1 hypothetical protein SAMN05414137_107161 [Streptacidiphilus jiangxiensis]